MAQDTSGKWLFATIIVYFGFGSAFSFDPRGAIENHPFIKGRLDYHNICRSRNMGISVAHQILYLSVMHAISKP